jgi:hypothetical protein
MFAELAALVLTDVAGMELVTICSWSSKEAVKADT